MTELPSADLPAGCTDAVVDRGRSVSYALLPGHMAELARHCVLDWLGVTIAGSASEAAVLVRAEAEREGGRPVATLIGTESRATASQAALVNGTSSHALDYDDMSLPLMGHPSVPVLPALMAAAEEVDASGDQVIAAFVAGYESECLVGRLLNPEHYARGFHATATLGTFGAAAACAHLLRLDATQWASALGIAGTQAAGLKSMFGTMAKPLHAGLAARNGYLAARLARSGFTAETAVLDSPQGFADTHGGEAHHTAFRAGLDDFDLAGVMFKTHAACAFTHSSIEGLLRIREETSVRPEQIANIVVRVPSGHLRAAGIERPATPLEAKFSLTMTSAMALATGDLSERAFTGSALADPVLTALRDKVEAIGEDTRADASHVEVVTIDGRVFEAEVAASKPRPVSDLDTQWSRLRAKFTGLAAPVLGVRAADDLADAVRETGPSTSIRDLTALAV
ncbi:MmgE/PrpD family protein [Streptomyces sp. BV129]|uniref:MmgE/PrpD family protein n=1 Tax=Streptomyces sp. BV129 TaxID=2849671 RepID=UPI0020C69D4A|nr:MmgE/PrpD family protein [Streptomyces sp. BV129]